MKMEEKLSKSEKEITLDDKIVQIILDEDSSISLEDIHSNDKRILTALNQDNHLVNNQYTFNGLARKLRMHQQSLSRSLHRLEDMGLVQKTDFGYKLRRNLDSILDKKSNSDFKIMSTEIPRQHPEFRQMLQMYLSDFLSENQIIENLAGKWFGNLRWIGLLERDEGYILQWMYGNRFQVNLKIISRYAIVESNSAGDKDNVEATVSACRIFEQITKLLQENQSNKPTRPNGLDSFHQCN